MKFIICLAWFAACAEVLPGSRDFRSTRTCDDPEEVSVAAGQVLKGAIVSDTESDGLYPNNHCQQWNIITDENKCIVVTVGDGGFDTNSGWDVVTFQDTGDSWEIRKYGDDYGIGQLLFISDTNNVDVTFTTSTIGRSSGFSLDVRSSSCTELDFCDGPVQEVEIPAGVTLEGAIVSDTHNDGKYRHNACQDWKIITDDNQCIVVTVGDEGFLTEDWVDTVVFMDSDSFAETQKSGQYPTGDVLFVSETNNVDVRFTSDDSVTENGFSLDIRSTSCTEAANLEEDEEPSEIIDNCNDPVEEVVVAAGETLKGALVTHTESDGRYPNRACQEWKIITDETQCIAINVGYRRFNLEYDNDFVTFKDSEGGHETSEGGNHPPGYLLFKSETNNVDVKFTSDHVLRFRGFLLDVRSISCTESGYNIQEVVVAAGETLEGAIVSDTGSDGNYRNNARQDWNIITDANQCIVIAVGDGGFNTESGWDVVTFKDSDSTSETERDGDYSSGAVLFTSGTNSVDVTFTSDGSITYNGFTLDVRSTDCADD